METHINASSHGVPPEKKHKGICVWFAYYFMWQMGHKILQSS